ncbi:hypothetical protein LIBO111022_00815 [Listeria booriae]|uniref:DUF4467 domain-containing protein n=1 Tax=Listeria booriae TaxID=1552123 RepID=A0A099WA93_9LIST|nr:hypothetical protein [Listeria booriae]KGL42689.1 hypothetical protein EP57_04310 [Listeria booriae]STY40924.1 Uncharacterised protein [Listeria booriae]
MKKIGMLGLMLMFLVSLVACGGSKYDEVIDKVVAQDKKSMSSNYMSDIADELNRKTADVKVYDDGKYIELKFGKNNYESFFKRMSDGSYEEASYDDKEYVKEDAKLEYEEKNGREVKPSNQ